MLFSPGKRDCGKRIGPYKLIAFLGQGRYGVCFRAEKDGQALIVKKYKSGMLRRNQAKNFYEAQILSQLQHPGIPRLIGIIDEPGFNGLALEAKSGVTLEAMLFKQKHRFSGADIFRIGMQLIAILTYLHEHGVVHRDLRIPNVLLEGDRVSVVDFGLARWEDRQRYTRESDFAYLGDLLLYLLYSNFQGQNRKNLPWYEELPLTPAQRTFLKRLLQLDEPYQSIEQVAQDFRAAFSAPPSSSGTDAPGDEI